MKEKKITIIAGPNGGGQNSLCRRASAQGVQLPLFVNAELFAAVSRESVLLCTLPKAVD